MNSILIIGGDKRQLIADAMLKNSGYKTYHLNGEKIDNINFNDYSAIILPVPSTKDEVNVFAPQATSHILLSKIFSSLNGQLLITGNYTPKYENYIDICKRYDYSFLNAVPTAEAAIGIAIDSTQKTLWKSKILIIGNGNIGKILSSRLTCFGADITVSARNINDFTMLDAMNIKKLNTNELKSNLVDFDIIFNTVPYPVLSKDKLEYCKKDCLLIELSSPPFGIDAQAAKNIGLKFIYAPSLPGKNSPITAGEILGKTLINILNENGIYPLTDMRSDC